MRFLPIKQYFTFTCDKCGLLRGSYIKRATLIPPRIVIDIPGERAKIVPRQLSECCACLVGRAHQKRHRKLYRISAQYPQIEDVGITPDTEVLPDSWTHTVQPQGATSILAKEQSGGEITVYDPGEIESEVSVSGN